MHSSFTKQGNIIVFWRTVFMTQRLRWRTLVLNIPFIAFVAFGRWCVDKGIVQLLH